jgi:glucose-6-phosphate 1-dehydrogenase
MAPVDVSAGNNPLRVVEDRRLHRIAGPSALVLFGVTGDLARKKLMPAVYDLANRGLLPPGFALVGFARRDWADQDFAQVVHDSVKEFARTEFCEEVWEQLLKGIRFISGTFDDDASFDRLKTTLADLDAEQGTMGNHCFYLSIPPGSFPLVTQQLSRSGLARADGDSWRRVVIEKPFGSDLTTARELNDAVESVFPADSIFRIDHYLGKENTLFEVVYVYLFQPEVKSLAKRLEQVMGERPGRHYALYFHSYGLGLKHTYDDRQSSVALLFAQYQSKATLLRLAGRKT